jgi:hypothetical protein
VRLRHPDPYQLDGDVIGDCRSLSAEVAPKALTVCIPEPNTDLSASHGVIAL